MPSEADDRAGQGTRSGLLYRTGVVSSSMRLVARSSPRLLGVTSCLQIVSALAGISQVVLAAQLVQQIVDGAAISRMSWLLLGAITTVAMLSAVSGVVSGRVQVVLGEAVARAVWARLLNTAASVPLVAFDSAEFSERLSRVRENALGRPLQVVTAVSSLTAGAVGLSGFMVYLGGVHWMLPVLVVVAGLPSLLVARITSRRSYQFSRSITSLFRLRLYTAELLVGRAAAKEIRAYGFGAWLRGRHDELQLSFQNRLVSHTRSQLVLEVAAALVSSVLGGVSLLALLVLIGSGRVGVAEAAGAALALRLLSGRVQQVFSGLGQLYESALFLEDLQSLPDQLPHGPLLDASREQLGPLRTLRMEGVGFSYPGAERPAVTDVDLELHPGQVLAVVGENGSGKTTLVKLVSHLYKAGEGRVLWNGRQVADSQIEAVRSRIAVLFQDFGRYAFSAEDNVYIGAMQDRGDQSRRDTATARAGAAEVVAGLANGWSTLLGAEYGGQDVSLGQWQRLALARAHFRHADLVILDEPTAALDPRAEARLFADVRRVLDDKAVLLITHRLASARTADVVVVMQDGAIVERGTHAELMEVGGVYAELWDLQAAGYAVDGSSAQGRRD